MISLATSRISKGVRSNVLAALDENRVAQGHFNEEFEWAVAKQLNVDEGVGTCNGTVADIVALAALSAKRPHKIDVIVPALTFIAHTNAVLMNGLNPVFVDVKADGQIDVEQIEAKVTKDTLAIMPANLLGVQCDIVEIIRIARKHNVFVLEDNCVKHTVFHQREIWPHTLSFHHTQLPQERVE